MKQWPPEIEQSYAKAARIARQASSSFYPSFWLLPREKRFAMCAFYAFARITDDVADSALSVDLKRRWLLHWRQQIESACGTVGETSYPPTAGLFSSDRNATLARSDHYAAEIFAALIDTQRKYDINPNLLMELIDGALLDQQTQEIATFADLEHYCYLVASTVGLVCLSIWQFDGDSTRQSAIDCGKAFQLTNVLRDIREDANQGRCYVAAEDLQRFDIVPNRSIAEQESAWEALINEYANRAEALYQSGWKTSQGVHPDGRPMFSMMWHSYHQLLVEIQTNPRRSLRQRLSLSWPRKLRIATSHFGPVMARRMVPFRS